MIINQNDPNLTCFGLKFIWKLIKIFKKIILEISEFIKAN